MAQSTESWSLVDGLIFSGGADIDPARYGETDVHPMTYDISDERDRFEIDLLQRRSSSGICRCSAFAAASRC